MAAAVKEQKMTYTSFGNVAYDPAYSTRSEAVERQEPLVRPRERVAGRAKVQVRAAGYVSPTAVIGFVLVGVMAVLLVWSYVQIAISSDKLVHLRSQSTQLAAEHSKLMAQYELAYDLKTVEETVTASGAMVQPQPGQLIQLDLSEPDSAQIYRPDQGLDAAKGVWTSFTEAVENIVAFFR